MARLYSTNDLVEFVLQELGVLDAGQPVAAEDAEAVLARLPGKIAELNARDVISIDPNVLTEEIILPLAKCLAWECANAFSIGDQTTLARLSAAGARDGEAEKLLRDVVRLRTPRQTLRCEYSGRRRGGLSDFLGGGV